MVDNNDDLENDVASLNPRINDAVFVNVKRAPTLSDVLAMPTVMGVNFAIREAHVSKLPTTNGYIDMGIIIDSMRNVPIEYFVVLINGERYVIASCWLEVASRC